MCRERRGETEILPLRRGWEPSLCWREAKWRLGRGNRLWGLDSVRRNGGGVQASASHPQPPVPGIEIAAARPWLCEPQVLESCVCLSSSRAVSGLEGYSEKKEEVLGGGGGGAGWPASSCTSFCPWLPAACGVLTTPAPALLEIDSASVSNAENSSPNTE